MNGEQTIDAVQSNKLYHDVFGAWPMPIGHSADDCSRRFVQSKGDTEMKCKVCWLFADAFLGAMMMYGLRLAVSYRTDPIRFHCPNCGAIFAQALVSLFVTSQTFLSLYKEIMADQPREAWHAYIKAFNQASVLELVIDATQHG